MDRRGYEPIEPPPISPEEAAMDRKMQQAYLQNLGKEQQYVSDQVNYMRNMVEASDLPPHAKERLFGLFDKTTAITQLDDNMLLALHAEALKETAMIRYLMPPEQLTENIVMLLEQVVTLHLKILLRSLKGFERELQNTSISLSHFIGDTPGSRAMDREKKPSGIRGFFSRGFRG